MGFLSMREKEFGVGKKIFNFLANNIGTITLVIILLFILTSLFSNQYDLLSKTYEKINNHDVIEQTIWFLTPKQQLLSILNNFLLNLSIAMIITFFILRYLEQQEKENFYKKLQEFQKNTAKDAIKSTFERIIEPEFFKIIEKDVLNAKFIRHNVKWDYDFSINSEKNKIQLKRTIIYTLKNITTNDEVEKFKIVSENNIHSKIIEVKFKYKKIGENKYIDIPIPLEGEGNSNKIETSKDITIEAQKEIQVIISWKEIFNCDYVYATHSIRFSIIGLELNVTFPKDYYFEIVVDTFSNKLEKFYGPVEGKIKYKSEGGLYKGQGIEFVLYKKENDNEN